MRLPVLPIIVLVPLAVLAACGDGKAPAAPTEQASTVPAHTTSAEADAPVVLAFGDSLYAGYQLAPGQSYPARLEAALQAQGIAARFVNAGVSGDTTAAGLQRLAFTLDNQTVQPSLVMVGLGGNDMLRGLPPEQTRANIEAICAELKKRGIPFMLTGLVAAPNMGPDYAAKFNAIYPDMAKKFDVPLVPFLLEPVFGKRELMLPDAIHPNAQGVEKIVGATSGKVAQALKDALKR